MQPDRELLATLSREIIAEEDLANPGVVKVVA